MALQWIGFLKQSGWMDLLKIGGIAGMVSSMVTLIWSGVRDGRLRRREAQHVALTLALSLESYARDARRMMHRASWARREAVRVRHDEPLRRIGLPEFTFPEPVEWRCLRCRSVSGVREFLSSLHSTRQSLAAGWEYAEPLACCDEAELECARTATRALELARMVRVQHGVAPARSDEQSSGLEKELARFVLDRQTRRESFQAELEQNTATMKLE
ncbi:hypothetical protein IST455A_05838 [Burkholderia multivorans]|uniref:hypothetical protein n=1 Tax=Burkholderia multivorans TaxID=87883 RepID=UPI0019C96EDB|nr:hypothetical protein [Burkholderia multivorans]CAB5305218.1 hypothetical protein IST495A_00178 [Burkholderia multivorans]CAB5311073.1 hypothetical protein IST419_05854 [Burkholderia multivorans]CAB5318757.1 hypothetical protein IST424_05838 [Burkholderia multivorans]CAB5320285.1 hypothetical protein IST455A_05838 [Burkholderia multivorans]CAB5320303.1 hypothetical protein IST453_05848 [Burkholderia multivorans]